ncbi:MAG: flagellar basal body-associated FliL family protein [Nitrospira sp.]|nr:flagellar basal body-associated FliL family protein [Nitrospira sp.]
MSEAAEEKAPAAPVAPAGMPMKMVLILLGGTLIVALGGAFVMFKMMSGSSDKPTAEGAAEKPAAHGETAAKEGGHAAGGEAGAIADLDPFIVNLADSPEVRYLKVTMKLEMEGSSAVEDVKARTPQIRDAILVLLTSLDSVTARSPQGKYKLREDVTQRINGLLPKKSVKTAYFTDFVIQ